MKSIVDYSHEFLKPALHQGAYCIDATLGNGHDTKFFLQENVYKVYAYEIQQDVFEKTMAQFNLKKVIGYCKSHEYINEIQDSIDAVIFNFGYCPHTDSDVTTTSSTSLLAVQRAYSLLKRKGRMALVFYPHEEGIKEADCILSWLSTLENVDIIKIEMVNKKCPYLIGIEKKAKS